MQCSTLVNFDQFQTVLTVLMFEGTRKPKGEIVPTHIHFAMDETTQLS